MNGPERGAKVSGWRLLPDDPEIGWTPFAWLIYLVPFVADPFFFARSNAQAVMTVVIAAVFLVLYFAGYWTRGWRLTLIIAAITALGVVTMPWNRGGAVFFIYAAAFTPWVDLTRRTAYTIIGSICVVVTGEALLLDLHPMQWTWGLVFAILIGALNVHSAHNSRLNAKLRLAQHEIEQLAKLAERERIARDLHDLVGHTLSVVILKAELASRLADRDPARARDEIREVESIAREALAQVRAAVSGYRTVGIDQELANAATVLRPAGVELEVSRDDTPFTPTEEAVLALAIRECMTNVIRHAGARRCQVAIRHSEASRTVVVRDDGRGSGGREGIGLRGMRERLALIGGTMNVSEDGGACITIELPPPLGVERAS